MKFKKAFTLVEMLIVIIIIGILFGALLPKFKNTQDKANDTARKMNLSQITTALEVYYSEVWSYPDWKCSSDLQFLKEKHFNLKLKDPQKERITYGTKAGGCKWSYGYSPLIKNWTPNWWAVLLTNTETLWKTSNYVLDGEYQNSPVFTKEKDIRQLIKKKMWWGNKLFK